ncbi:M56 family metallopeptidase [Persicobacter diffluens]|uniref:TonB C-terminal domain-containing protein n=1 Tax=Persicobacter diffluens TaxID=981 RepID=A0AAN5AKI4_9BACT|nr:hypothetical protein PEDI_04750 [Persicobacter diffluens]
MTSTIFTTHLSLLVATALYYFLLRGRKRGQFNRIFLVLSALMAFLMPGLASLHFSFFEQETMVASSALLLSPVEINATVETVNREVDSLMLIYWLGFGVLAFRFLVQFGKFTFHLLRNDWQVEADYIRVYSQTDFPICSWFNFLFWPSSTDLKVEDQSRILAHELGHIRQWHSLDRLFLDFCSLIWWFNPAIWLLKAALEEEHEYLADACSLKEYPDEKAYAQLLASNTLGQFGLSMGHPFFNSKSLKRIRMIKSDQKISVKRALMVVGLFAVVGFWACQHDEMNPQPEQGLNLVEGQQVDVFPEFEGGSAAFQQYIKPNLNYPEDIQAYGIEGEVLIQFEVDETGAVRNVKLLQGIGEGSTLFSAFDQLRPNEVININRSEEAGKVEGFVINMRNGGNYTLKRPSEQASILDEVLFHHLSGDSFDGRENNKHVSLLRYCRNYINHAAVKVVKEAPNWKPAMKNGAPVSVQMVLPVHFVIDG